VLLTRDLARRLTAPIGLACPHRSRLPPPASLAPIGLACPWRPRLPLSASPDPMARRTARQWYSALGSGFGLRLWQLALGFPSLSFIYKSIVFLLLDRQTIHLLLHLLVSTGYEPGAELNSTPTISIFYCLSSAPVPVDRADILVVPLSFFNLRPSLLFLNLCPLDCLANLCDVDHDYKTQ